MAYPFAVFMVNRSNGLNAREIRVSLRSLPLRTGQPQTRISFNFTGNGMNIYPLSDFDIRESSFLL